MNPQLPPTSSTRHPVRAFATMNALLILILIAAALSALSLLFATQAQRTQAAPIQAQQRQLFLAAATFVPRYLPTDPAVAPLAQKVKLPLPTLSTRTPHLLAVTLDLKPLAPNQVEVTIDATVDNQIARQRLTYKRENQAWLLTTATLLSPPPKTTHN